MSALTWEQLDACQSSDEIAELLRAAGVKGIKHGCKVCPLAIATGWIVDEDVRWPSKEEPEQEPLTEAEIVFIYRFDEHDEYDDLMADG